MRTQCLQTMCCETLNLTGLSFSKYMCLTLAPDLCWLRNVILYDIESKYAAINWAVEERHSGADYTRLRWMCQAKRSLQLLVSRSRSRYSTFQGAAGGLSVPHSRSQSSPRLPETILLGGREGVSQQSLRIPHGHAVPTQLTGHSTYPVALWTAAACQQLDTSTVDTREAYEDRPSPITRPG